MNFKFLIFFTVLATFYLSAFSEEETKSVYKDPDLLPVVLD